MPGLRSISSGNSHLADVVQKCAARNHLDLNRGDAHGARQSNGIGGHPFRMPFGFGVLQVKCVAQRLERHVVGVFEIFHGLAQHLGAGAHNLFEILLVVVTFLERLAMIERPLHCGDQMLALKRLEQIVVGAATHRVNGHADVVDRTHHDHGKLRLLGVDTLQQGDAVTVLHHNVGQNQVEGILNEHFHGLGAADGQLHIIPLPFKSRANHRPDRRLVVNHKYAGRLPDSRIGARLRVRGLRRRGVHSTQICQVRCQTLLSCAPATATLLVSRYL